LRINAGEMVALVGVSGVGKSTLADLIPRFYDVSAGRITLDGIDIRDLSIRSLRAQIGIVTQHTFLFNDTVRKNIAYGDPSRPMAEVICAAKAAHAHEFIMAMPQGYDSVIGEMGMQLSGVQRQRLAIARALLKNAPIHILDEATSALDAESERWVQDALDNLITTRTTLVIAHRLSTIRKADRIVVLADGRIVEEGSHEELLARKREYSRLYTLQQLEAEAPEADGTLH
jgi:subfamily B ATP-binding cassette protein MsbA